ncbi:MAG: ABC transporter ATP-binding protein, partial [Actinobacteria bacterium]|nr:ABC transporter ATP-binding protein [Actinomycetota bacterium]
MFKILRTYFKRFVPYLVVAVLFTFLQVYAELKLPDLMSDIVDVGIVGRDVSYIMQVGAIMLGWALFSMACIVGVSYCAAHAAMAFGRDVRQGVFHKVESFSTYEFDEFGTSSLITRATNDVQQIERIVQMLMSMALMAPFMFVGAAVMAWIKSPELSMIIFGAIPIMLIFIAVMVKYGMPLLRSLQERIDKLNLVTRENLTGMRVIRAYNKEDAVEERFAEANSGLAETNVKVARLMGGLMPLIFLTVNFAIVIIIWKGALGVYAGTLLVGDMMAIIQYATMVLFSIMMLSMMFAMLPRALAAGDRINEVLERLPEIRDDAQPVRISGDVRGLLELEHVSFKFKDAEKPSICDVSVRFSPGETTAIIGSTGSGKSTLLNLIMRFYDPT